MNDQQTIIIPKEYKKNLDKSFNINGVDIMLPVYVRASISKYRFIIEDNIIFLQRQCKECNQFFNVQKFENGVFTNINTLQMKYLGERSGFHNTCNNCLEKSPIIPNTSNVKGPLSQINIRIDEAVK